MRLPRPLRRPRRPAISAEPWLSSHRRHCAARDHWAHAPVCPLSPGTVPPPASRPSRCGGNGALAGKIRAACIPFSPSVRKRPPPWQYLREMHASRDQDGKILALCVHFRAQSGDPGCMRRESCRQGPFFASRARKSYVARRCCQRCPAFRARRPANWPNGLCPLRPGPGPLAACTGLCHLVRPAATRARGPPPVAAIRTSASHPNAAVTHAAAFIAAALHVAPAVLTTLRAQRRHPSHRPLWSGVGCRSDSSRVHPPPHRHSRLGPVPRGLRCGSRNSREIVR